MQETSFNLIIVGVGGQGTLLASKILGYLALQEGLDVKVSEVHGMAQRGGSVITHVRVGSHVHSPLVTEGTADFLMSFEALEAARAMAFLKPGGTLIVNTQQILPMPVISGVAEYPEAPLSCFSETCTVCGTDALGMAVSCGNQRAVNMVLMGMLSRHLSWSEEAWREAIAASVKPATLEANLAAFTLGREQEQ